MTRYLRPRNLKEALQARADHPDWLAIAGCTDLMVGAAGRPRPMGLIDLFGLSELVGVRRSEDDLVIGAATPYAQILTNPDVQRHLPALAACVREIGAAQIQARGTMGGNVGTSSPVGDTLPVLLAHDARVRVASSAKERVLPYREFCTGYRTTALGPDELITAIEIPVPTAATRTWWRKVGTRRAQSISKVMGAFTAQLEGGKLSGCRVAFGAVADRPVRLETVEGVLEGAHAGAEVADAAAEAVRGSITPIDDVRSSADYRRFVASNLVRRFVLQLAGA